MVGADESTELWRDPFNGKLKCYLSGIVLTGILLIVRLSTRFAHYVSYYYGQICFVALNLVVGI